MVLENEQKMKLYFLQKFNFIQIKYNKRHLERWRLLFVRHKFTITEL